MWERPGPREPGQPFTPGITAHPREPQETHARRGDTALPEVAPRAGRPSPGTGRRGNTEAGCWPQRAEAESTCGHQHTYLRRELHLDAQPQAWVMEPRSPAWSGFCLPPGRRVVPSPKGRSHHRVRVLRGGGPAGSAPPAKSQPHSKGQPVRRGSARGDTHLGTGKAQAHSQLKQVLVFLPSLNPVRD